MMPSYITARKTQISFLLEMQTSSESLDSCLDEYNFNSVFQKAAKNSRTALLSAVRKADIDCVKVLIDAGSEIDVSDEEGNTPLAVALRAIYQNKKDES